ncbi:hypothetical protein [Actinomadura violacea]|uniref:Uncharacterized protein n=1 Tax=Actinomadura violacea TaxID=2819934 RepID=A0ABS3RQZ1_9ACTN|nr:hypothetical protein [Actinomadura violacea]MBO2458500.1 hypothetical protein [Actinomadura violacea]
MPSKAKPPESRPVTITAVIDPVAALASGALEGNLFLYDTNKAEGSAGFGGTDLRTRVRSGDRIIWNVVVLECETYAALDEIVIDEKVCTPERKVYPNTDIAYWTATVKRHVTEPVPYRLKFRLGTVTEPYAVSSPALVGQAGAGKEQR